MNPAICCPRCSRYSPSRARFCANCGLSFVSAGLVPESAPRPRRSGGFFGVFAGMLLLFVLIAAISILQFAIPYRMFLRHNQAQPFQQRTVRIERVGGDGDCAEYRVIKRRGFNGDWWQSIGAPLRDHGCLNRH